MPCNGFTIPNFNPKKVNFFLMFHFTCTCIKFFTKSIQIIKKTLHTSIISESIQFLLKQYQREIIKTLSKILLCTIRGK